DLAVLLRQSDGVAGEGAEPDLAEYLHALGNLMRRLAFLSKYQLVVPRRGRREKWMGLRRPQGLDLESPDSIELAEDEPFLATMAGRPILSLKPLVQVAEPAPGSAKELFLLAGQGRFGARLIAYPMEFERDDEGVWAWLAEHVTDVESEASLVAREERSPYR